MLNVALIGAGGIARGAHLPAWRVQPDAEVTLLVDVRLDAAQKLAQEFGIPRVSADVQSAFEDPSIDVVDLCLPHNLHVPMALAALRAGKHVLLEKPIAVNLPSARQIIAASQEAHSIFMQAENWRYQPVSVAAADLLRSGVLGDPFMLKVSMEFYFRSKEGSWRMQREVSGGGVLIDSGIHAVSVARMLMGEIREVIAARGRQIWDELAPSEDTIAILTHFAGGSIGIIDFSWSTHHERSYFGFEVFGTDGSLSFDLASGGLTIIRDGRREERQVPWSSGFTEEIRHFLDCIRDGRQPKTTAVEEARTLAAVLAAYQSVDTRQWTAPESL
ncbi:MAG: Gfo/Idh/MocA family oxidoreductase [Chloroflexi bacterium]|nr:Gfo/Idh/MocA family oxidoreductase [Chloroflexota bacterium]